MNIFVKYQTGLWLTLLCVLSFAVGNGNAPLFDLDEGAFSAATMEMLQRGDFITTYLNGELRFDKPILIYWLQALSVSHFGLNEFAFRLPSVLMASIWITSFFYFSRVRMSPHEALTGTVMLASAMGVVVIGRAATADALLNALLCLTLLDAYRAFERPDASKRTIQRAYLWIGLGLLAKGPIAILVPLATVTLFALVTGRWLAWTRILFNPIGWLITLIVAAPWYVAEYIAQGQAFINGFIFQHNLSRFNSTFEGHGGHWYYYLAILPVVMAPHVAILGRSVLQLSIRNLTTLQTFGLCWFGFVFVFFSLSNTQLPHYILYGLGGLILLVTPYAKRLGNIWFLAPTILLLGVYMLLPVILENVANENPNDFLSLLIKEGLGVFNAQYYLTIAFALAALLVTLFIRPRNSLTLTIAALIHTMILTLVIIPAVGQIQQGPTKEAALIAKSAALPVYSLQLNHPSFSVYYGQPVPRKNLKTLPDHEHLLFTKTGHQTLDRKYQILYQRGGILLLQIDRRSRAAAES